MIARSEGVDKDISAKAVQDKLDQMVLIWEDIWSLTEEREAKLLDVMKLAAKLWCSHVALAATIKDTQELIGELEGPGVDPSVVTQEQEDAEAAKEETDGLQEELATVLSLGSELRAACGEPDKPVVNKSIDELNSAWDALSKTRKERADKLVEALQAAVQYQDGLQALCSTKKRHRVMPKENPKPGSQEEERNSDGSSSIDPGPSWCWDGSAGDPGFFPCGECGRVFEKIQGRNAHMRLHRPQDV
ncbi:microtubule-actin cross-linking factor 1, isoforms 6/7-like [Larus michahellis]|uniref:microtubule-actin cross-linking factor 1, isoforms 6/7-like n=1 Tax=Larus michahellis TaxID=119627 RepID=UPI003D9B854E